MTLSPATSVGFAVAGGAPSDVRQWIVVDLAGYPGSGRRGYAVATEPLVRSWQGIELASQAREIIVTELRRLRHLPVDEALGRSFAAANGIVFARNRDRAVTGLDEAPLIGATAIIFEDQTATIAHLPPGQMILVEDGLVYMVPEFASWFPDYQQPRDASTQAEPLGYASWTAPTMAQTELRAGDTIVLCTAEAGRAYAEGIAASGHSPDDLAWIHHRDPDRVLESLKDVVIAGGLTNAAAAVISFPPLPNSAQIQTIGDVVQRGRDSWRHGKAILRQLRPARGGAQVADMTAQAPPPPSVADVERTTVVRRRRERPVVSRGKQRVQQFFEPGPDRKAGWRRPAGSAEYGVPGAHGVDVYRGQTHYMGDPSWRHNLPRLPIIGSAWIWPLFALIVASLVVGAFWVREELLAPDIDVQATLGSIDRQIVQARDADTDEETAAELEDAQQEIDRARANGVSDEELDRRQQVVTEMLDEATNVVRVSDVRRIGTLPEEFGDARVQGVYTPAGVFFVAGSLYQYRPNQPETTPELVTILSEGDTVDGTTVGTLWGLAFDVKGLYVTDGEAVFMLPVESQEWKAVRLGRINNQEWKPGPIAAFDGSIYLLEAEYRQIYRFAIAETETQAEPRDWLLTGARDRMSEATDIAIESSIYVLLSDGTVMEMYQGDPKKKIVPPYVGEDMAEALVGRGNMGYLYEAVSVEDSDEGRIVAFDIEGRNAVQLKLPVGFTTGDANVREPFDGVQDVIVDESTGTIYIINADGIWTARYSLPELPEAQQPDEPTATPVAE